MILSPNRQYVTRHGWTTVTAVKVIDGQDQRFPWYVMLISGAGQIMRQWYTNEGRWFGKPNAKKKQIDSEWDLVKELKP